MSTSQHTPGPWTHFTAGSEVWIGIKTPGSTLHIATVPRAGDGDWSEANARLIAAAPELLAALKLLTYGAKKAVANGLVQPQVNGGLILAEAAIAKAESSYLAA